MKSKPIPRTSIAGKLPKREQDTKRNQLRKITKWAAAMSEHPHLYCPPTQAAHYHYYQIEFYEISDIEVLLGKRKQYIQITCILFNKQTYSFVGSTYASQMFEVEANKSEKPSCLCKKSVFFYTDQQEMCLKVDIWRLQSEKNGKGVQNMTKRIYLGHFEADLGESRQSGIIQKQLKNNQLLRFVSVEESEPRTEMSEQQGKKIHSKIVYRVINTHSLSHLHHFIPANHVFDQHNSILGLKDMRIGSKGEIEMGDRSRLIFQLKSITVPLTVVKYLTDVSELKINSTFAISGRPTINIKEMRYNIEFHNGWKSICFESILLKEVGAQTAGIETNRSLMPSKMQSKISKVKQTVMKNKLYTFDKSKQLKAVFVGEGVLVMWIEAKVECKFEVIENGAKKSRGEVFFLPLAFALKTLPQFEQQSDFNVQLFEGNPYNFKCLVDYFSQLNNKQQTDDLSDKLVCNISMLLQKSGGTIDNIETVEKEINQIQNLKIEKERLARLKRKVREEKRKKLIELNQEIPFLDTTQLREELYQEQLTKVKNEKLEQQQILFFLKAKINQLQREAFKNELNIEEIEDQDALSPNKVKVKKLPNHFIDYRPEPEAMTISQSTILSYFNSRYCKLALAPPRLASNKLLQECMQGETFLQLKITSFECFSQQINNYTLMVPNYEGRFECLAITPLQFANKSVQVKLSFSREKTMDILNSLLNGFFQIFLQCNSNQHLKGTSLITISELISKCSSGDLLESISENALFTQEGTPLAYASFIIAFTNASSNQALAEAKVEEKINSSPSKQFSLLSRIQRFKEQKGLSDKKKQLVNQILSTSKINKISVNVQQSRPSKFKLSIANTSNVKEEYLIYIFDEDEPYHGKEELSIGKSPHLFIGKNDKRVEVEPNASEQLQFTYLSERININMSTVRGFDKRKLHNLYKGYNHQHKININFAKRKSNIVVERYEVIILPQSQYSNFVISKFIAKEENFNFPIPTVNLEVSHNKNITQSTTGITLHVPELKKEQLHLSHFELVKRSKECSLTFQRIQFYGWKCHDMQVSARLWETKDVLLNLPFQAILNEQLSLPYLIQDLIIASHHVNLKIRQTGTFAYTSELKVNRKMNEIFIRAQATFNQIGKFCYGVEISDKNQHVFHRIGVTSNIEFPTLASHQIIPVNVPKEDMETVELFVFKNRQQTGIDCEAKCNQPHLLAFKESKIFLKEGQQWSIQLQFNWNRIMDEMIDQSKEEVSILVGIISKLAIQYLLFKCRAN